jgi:hypothetical protein
LDGKSFFRGGDGSASAPYKSVITRDYRLAYWLGFDSG